MSWYKAPITPYDPIIKDPSASPPEGAIRYFRDNFEGDGQDSNTLPPAQNQQLWQQLTNIQPITQGALSRRWGYNLIGSFTTSGAALPPILRTYALQNNNTLTRQLVFCTNNGVYVSGEGPSSVTGIFNNTGVYRMVDSRNYAYFYDGVQVDLQKWDGIVGDGSTNWGIVAPGLSTVSTSAGPFLGSVDSVSGGGNVWTHPEYVLTNTPPNYAAYSISGTSGTSQFINVTGFGFSVPANATITGIQVSITYGPPIVNFQTQPGTLSATLLKVGTPYAQTKTFPSATPSGGSFNTTAWSNTMDLWGGNWTPGDINNSAFGVQFQAQYTPRPPGTLIALAYNLTVKVFYTSSSSAISVAIGGAGNVNLTVGRTYYCIFQNSRSGHLSDLNQASAGTGPVVNSVVNLTSIPVSADTQVDNKIILATADGGDPSILYFVGSVPNATTTFTDNTPEVTLNLNQQYLFTDPFGNEFGVTFNDPPPNGSICIKHKGRLWMAQLQNLYFSKSVAELTLPNGFIAGKYEECWNPSNYFDISGGAETISGLFSDGNVIYIGTQSHIRRIFGDSPTNFQQPEICHQDVGVLNQETWQNVYLEGTPTGFMWLTPDFKVMGSDGNTYLDIGHPIQDVLSSINPAGAQNAHAMFVQQGPYDLYILAIPTGTFTSCDTHCIYDMRNHQWSIWKPTDVSTSMLFNVSAAGVPQWYFTTNQGTLCQLYQYVPTATQDRGNAGPIDFVSTAVTSYLHLGSPTTRKILDELEIVGDPGMFVTVNGASSQADFLTPHVIASNFQPKLSPFSTYKIYLAGRTSRYHYYQLKFLSQNNSNQTLLQSYSLRAVPWNTL